MDSPDDDRAATPTGDAVPLTHARLRRLLVALWVAAAGSGLYDGGDWALRAIGWR
jgi:hypothetical protein